MRLALSFTALCCACALASCDQAPQATEATAVVELALEYEREYHVDCLGMGLTLGTGDVHGRTRLPRFSDLTYNEQDFWNEEQAEAGKIPPRCEIRFNGPIEPGPQSQLLTVVPYTYGTRGARTISIAYLGKLWYPLEAQIVLEGAPDSTKGSGWYDGVFYEARGGSTARIRGRLSYCEPGARPDCDFAGSGGLDKQFEVVIPGYFEGASAPCGGDVAGRGSIGWGEAVACRALIDKSTGAMQVEMQIGSWKGMNITQMFNITCGADYDEGFYSNFFRFRTGGVTGPGSYGPVQAINVSEQTLGQSLECGQGDDRGPACLPELSFELPYPFLFAGHTAPSPCLCAWALFRPSVVSSLETVCSYDLAEDGEFRLSCSAIVSNYPQVVIPRPFGSAPWIAGDFELWATCDIEYK